MLRFSDDEGLEKAWLYDGNHRVAVAYFIEVEHLEIDIISSHDDRILEVLPGAVPINAPQQNPGGGA